MRVPNFPVRYLPLSIFMLCLIGLIALYIVDPDVPQTAPTAVQEPVAPLPVAAPVTPAATPEPAVTPEPAMTPETMVPSARVVAPLPVEVVPKKTPPEVKPAPRCRPRCQPHWRWRRW